MVVASTLSICITPLHEKKRRKESIEKNPDAGTAAAAAAAAHELVDNSNRYNPRQQHARLARPLPRPSPVAGVSPSRRGPALAPAASAQGALVRAGGVAAHGAPGMDFLLHLDVGFGLCLPQIRVSGSDSDSGSKSAHAHPVAAAAQPAQRFAGMEGDGHRPGKSRLEDDSSCGRPRAAGPPCDRGRRRPQRAQSVGPGRVAARAEPG